MMGRALAKEHTGSWRGSLPPPGFWNFLPSHQFGPLGERSKGLLRQASLLRASFSLTRTVGFRLGHMEEEGDVQVRCVGGYGLLSSKWLPSECSLLCLALCLSERTVSTPVQILVPSPSSGHAMFALHSTVSSPCRSGGLGRGRAREEKAGWWREAIS